MSTSNVLHFGRGHINLVISIIRVEKKSDSSEMRSYHAQNSNVRIKYIVPWISGWAI